MLRIIKSKYHFSNISYSQLINPYTHELLTKKNYIQDYQLFTKISQATVAQSKWKKLQLNQKIQKVSQLIKSILLDKNNLKIQIANQLGKSYKNINSQFQKVDNIIWNLIQCSKKSLENVIIKDNQQKLEKYIFQSVGSSLIFPYYSQPILDSVIHLVPCLLSGGCALIKSSDYNHFLGGYLEKKSQQILGYKSLISDIYVQPNSLESLSQFRSIKKVIYSGTQISAKHIFETLVKKRFIDCNLFFGGQDSAYVDESADIKSSAKQICKYTFYNNGQSYDCIKRLYLHTNIIQQFLSQLQNQIINIKIGNPHQETTDLGPLCIQQASPQIQKLISDAVSNDAKCLIGGILTTDGNTSGIFCEPTVLYNCTNDMLIVQTLLGAPVLCILQTNSEKQFVQMVNDSQYGNGCRIFTSDFQRYNKYIDEIQVGRISFNSATIINKNLPIQGWKKSGKGKILSNYSYQQYTLTKTFNIKRIIK